MIANKRIYNDSTNNILNTDPILVSDPHFIFDIQYVNMINIFFVFVITLILIIVIIDTIYDYHNETFQENERLYFFYVSKSQRTGSCSHDIRSKRVGYISELDKSFIDAIQKGYRINAKDIVKLNPIVPNFSSVDFAIVSMPIDPNNQLYKMITSLNLFIYSFDTINIDRISIFLPVKSKKSKLRVMFPQNNIIIKNLNYVEVPLIETFITRLKRDPEVVDTRYNCVGDKNLLNKPMCNSPTDPFGNPKKQLTIWDRMCENDLECPFYNKNKLYQRNRGGCINGHCEMPVGIKKIGYRKYYDKGIFRPFCHNGSDDKSCTSLDNPEYIFPIDR